MLHTYLVDPFILVKIHVDLVRTSPRTSVTMKGLHINTLSCNPFIVTGTRRGSHKVNVYLDQYKRVYQICMKHYQFDFVDLNTTTSYN